MPTQRVGGLPGDTARHRLGEPLQALGAEHRAGCDGIDPDAVGAPLHRTGTGERVDPGLGRRHVGLVHDTPLLEGGADVHDGSTALPHAGLEGRLGDVVGAEQVDVDDRFEPVGGDRRHRGGEVARRVVDHDVERTPLGHDPVDHRPHGLGVAHVADTERGVDPLGGQFGDGGFELLVFAAGHHDGAPVGTEDPADLLADPGGATGHQGDPAGQQVGGEAARLHRYVRLVHVTPGVRPRARRARGTDHRCTITVRHRTHLPPPGPEVGGTAESVAAGRPVGGHGVVGGVVGAGVGGKFELEQAGRPPPLAQVAVVGVE